MRAEFCVKEYKTWDVLRSAIDNFIFENKLSEQLISIDSYKYVNGGSGIVLLYEKEF